MRRVRKRELTFGDGDVLIVDMVTETRNNAGKLSEARTIVKVKDHKTPSQYRQMEFDEADSDWDEEG